MDWLLNLLRQKWNRPAQEFDMGNWRTNDQIPRNKGTYTYSDTPIRMGNVGNRMPDWIMSGNTQWGTASFPEEPTQYDQRGLLNKLLSAKPGTFQQRMDVERMLLDDQIKQFLENESFRKPQRMGM